MTTSASVRCCEYWSSEAGMSSKVGIWVTAGVQTGTSGVGLIVRNPRSVVLSATLGGFKSHKPSRLQAVDALITTPDMASLSSRFTTSPMIRLRSTSLTAECGNNSARSLWNHRSMTWFFGGMPSRLNFAKSACLTLACLLMGCSSSRSGYGSCVSTSACVRSMMPKCFSSLREATKSSV